MFLVKRTDFGRDREPWRDGDAEPAHLREAGALSPEKIFLGSIPFRRATTERIDVFGRHLVSPGCAAPGFSRIAPGSV